MLLMAVVFMLMRAREGGGADSGSGASELALPLAALSKRWPLTFHSASKVSPVLLMFDCVISQPDGG